MRSSTKTLEKPSVDLGHPRPAHGRIPAFPNVDEEAVFWDTHRFTDFEDEFIPVEVTVNKHPSIVTTVSSREAIRRIVRSASTSSTRDPARVLALHHTKVHSLFASSA